MRFGTIFYEHNLPIISIWCIIKIADLKEKETILFLPVYMVPLL